jgi:hypothetical protein
MESILEAWRKARDSTKLAQNMQQLIKDFENSFRLLRGKEWKIKDIKLLSVH